MHFLSAYAWLPFTVGAFSRWAERRDRRWLAASAGFLLLQLLAGDPQSAYLAVGVCLLVSAFSERWKGRWARAAAAQWPVAAVAGVAGLCAAVVLWPALELLRLSSRTEEVSLAASQIWSLHPLRLVELLLPAPFGTYFPVETYWGHFTVNASYGTPYYLSLYFGASGALLAALGVATRAPRERALLLAIAGLGLLVSLGRFTPLYGWMYRALPVWNAFRYPERVVVVVVLAGAVLAGGGVDALRQGPPRWWRASVLVFTVVAAAVWAAAAMRGADLAATFTRWTGTRISPEGMGDLATSGSHAASFLLVLSLLALAAPRLRPSLFVPVVVLLAAADVLVSGARLVWLAPAELFFKPGHFIQAMPPAGEFRVDWDPSLKGMVVSARTQVTVAFMHRVVERATLKPNTALLEGHCYLGGYGSASPRWLWDQYGRLPRDAYYDWYSVRYLAHSPLAGRDWLKAHPEEKMVAQYGPAMLIERPGAYPRQWLVHRTEVVDSDAAMMKTLAAKPDLRSVAFVDHPLPGLGGADLQGEVRVRHRGAQRVGYSVFTASPALLVMNDGYWPGWRAVLDGAEVPLVRVNGGMRGVRIPPGDHELEVVYRPDSLAQGAAGSALGLLALAALGLWRRRPRADAG
jgi:hypothetical protein